MSWQCRMVEYGKETSGHSLSIGDMFFFNPPPNYDYKNDDIGWYWPKFHARELSDFYHANHTRPPLLVYLPGRSLFCVDSKCWKPSKDGGKSNYYGGWKVIGDPPLITVSPSINMVGIYHGYLRNGVISDDVEGRVYDQHGNLIKP